MNISITLSYSNVIDAARLLTPVLQIMRLQEGAAKYRATVMPAYSDTAYSDTPLIVTL